MPRSIVCRQIGEPDVLTLETFESEPLQPGQVRIAVRAAGLNYTDVLTVAGKYQYKPPLPFVPGAEAAGDVIEVGDGVTKYSIGDRVIAKPRHGAFSEEIVAAESGLRLVPRAFDYAEGATFFSGHGTAYHALVYRAHLSPGETVLVHGASGGVGLAAVGLAKVYGARVIGIGSSAEKLDIIRQRGADHTLRSGEPFRDKVKEWTGGKGADVVIDPVGGVAFEESLRCINFGARICVIGFLGGVGLARTNLVLIKSASVLGIRAGEDVRHHPEIGEARQRELYRLADERKVSPNISHGLPLERCAEAMRLLMDRKAIGRVALTMS
jgi:NADPH2:quinone reductase